MRCYLTRSPSLRPPWMAEVPVLQEQQTGRPPWMAEVPVLQEQQTGRLLFSDNLPELGDAGQSLLFFATGYYSRTDSWYGSRKTGHVHARYHCSSEICSSIAAVNPPVLQDHSRQHLCRHRPVASADDAIDYEYWRHPPNTGKNRTSAHHSENHR